MSKVLIDADIVAYRAAWSTQDDTREDAEEKVDECMEYILNDTTFDGVPYECFITGKGNFRYDIAVSHPYKGNRKDTAKPEHLDHCRDYLEEYWEATRSENEEADDLIAIRATELGPHAVIASVDKDFLQVPCVHYNTRRQDFTTVSEHEGILFFYKQMLMGDKADNIVGLHRVGPKTADKMLHGAKDEYEMYDLVLEAYGGNEERVLENGRLLWLRREVGELWQPPK
jgi:DNA polymerase-1